MLLRRKAFLAWALGSTTFFLCGAAAQQDFSEPPPLSEMPQFPKVILDEGNYAIVEKSSVGDKSRRKHVDVECPDGLRAISVGVSAPSGRGEPDDWRVILSQPNDTGTGWSVYAMFDGLGRRGGIPAPYEWSIKVRLVCANLS